MLFHRVTSLRLSLYPFPFFPAIFAFIRLPMQRVTRQSETTLSLYLSLYLSLSRSLVSPSPFPFLARFSRSSSIVGKVWSLSASESREPVEEPGKRASFPRSIRNVRIAHDPGILIVRQEYSALSKGERRYSWVVWFFRRLLGRVDRTRTGVRGQSQPTLTHTGHSEVRDNDIPGPGQGFSKLHY